MPILNDGKALRIPDAIPTSEDRRTYPKSLIFIVFEVVVGCGCYEVSRHVWNPTIPETVARSADDVGHLEGGAVHRLISLRERFTVSRLETSVASIGLGKACRWRRERCR